MADFASKLPFSMPFVAKKKHKYSLFSPSVSCARLRKVQSILKADGLDGILCVHGIDSRYNSGTKQLLNHLLFDYCNISAESISVRFTDESLEDLVVLIKHESVHVYCNPINYPLILPFIGHWRNLHLYCLSKEEDDEEKTEEFKILSFISMVKGCPKIGIPYGHDHIQKAFDVFTIEKWPLIQAFALEGFGGGGFFTMVHEVVDVTSNLNQVYGSLDPVVAEILITERLPLFERHCKSVLTNIDVESGVTNGLTKLTESFVSEPIVSYYKHGHRSDSSINITSDKDQLEPFVLFGVNTTKEILNDVNTRHNKGCFSSCGISGSPAKHLVCCSRDPKGIISCVRTYFFGNGFLPYTESPTDLKQSDQSKDLRLMIDLYLLAVSAVLKGIQSFTQSQDVMKAKGVVDSILKNGINKKNILVGPKHVKFSIEGQDFLGRKVESQNSPSINMAFLYLYDIPSIEHPGKTLGSVAFGETFLHSAVKSLAKDGTSDWNCKCLILTENVSRFASWMDGELEEKSSKRLEEFVKSKEENTSFGKQLVYGDRCYVVGETKYSKNEEGTLYVYEKGFIFIHPRCGAVSLPFSVISNMQFYDGESSSTVALMILKYIPSLTSHLPAHLVNNNNTLVIALMPRTKIFRQFYSDVLPLWKNNSHDGQPKLEMITDLLDDLNITYLGLKDQKSVPHRVDMEHTVQHALVSFEDLKSFLAHLNVSSSGDVPVQADDLAVILEENHENANAKDNTNLELLLTILTGVPGSGKDQLCDTLVNLAKENSKWIILRSPLTHILPFDAQALQASLSNTLKSQKKLIARMSTGRKRVRVILVTPGFFDIVDVVQAIYSHPNPEVKQFIRIGAITCCIDPQNMFMEERYTLPKLLDQCAQGWANNIVFTGCLDPQNDKLAMVQKLIRTCNHEAAFILAKGGEVTRSSDVELILSDSVFMKESEVRKRHLMCPGWSLGVFNSGCAEPPVNEICINLFGPLDKRQFTSKLRGLQGPIHLKDCLTTGAIHSIRGHVHFVGQNTVTEVHWTALRGSLTMTTVDMTAMPRPPSKTTQNGDVDHYTLSYFIVFTGFSLKEASLKDWLRTCAKQRPHKKKLKTLKDLTKEELDQISANHKCDPLPEGWFYTGNTYVSLTGDKAFQHPLMDKFIQQYLTSTNDDIIKHNASVDAMPQVDILKRS